MSPFQLLILFHSLPPPTTAFYMDLDVGPSSGTRTAYRGPLPWTKLTLPTTAGFSVKWSLGSVGHHELLPHPYWKRDWLVLVQLSCRIAQPLWRQKRDVILSFQHFFIRETFWFSYWLLRYYHIFAFYRGHNSNVAMTLFIRLKCHYY